jgi:hypothetical protein
MKRYVIERDIPKVGSPSREEFCGLAATSRAALTKLAGKMIAGLPVTKVSEVPIEIGPSGVFELIAADGGRGGKVVVG